MQFLTDSHIDFMKYRKVFIWVSILFLVIAGAELFFMTGLNLGIDFAGGTQLTVRLRYDSGSDHRRRGFENAGLREAQIQRLEDLRDQRIAHSGRGRGLRFIPERDAGFTCFGP